MVIKYKKYKKQKTFSENLINYSLLKYIEISNKDNNDINNDRKNKNTKNKLYETKKNSSRGVSNPTQNTFNLKGQKDTGRSISEIDKKNFSISNLEITLKNKDNSNRITDNINTEKDKESKEFSIINKSKIKFSL